MIITHTYAKGEGQSYKVEVETDGITSRGANAIGNNNR